MPLGHLEVCLCLQLFRLFILRELREKIVGRLFLELLDVGKQGFLGRPQGFLGKISLHLGLEHGSFFVH